MRKWGKMNAFKLRSILNSYISLVVSRLFQDVIIHSNTRSVHNLRSLTAFEMPAFFSIFLYIWPGDVIWHHLSWLTLDQVMVYCLKVLSHCLSQLCFICTKPFNPTWWFNWRCLVVCWHVHSQVHKKLKICATISWSLCSCLFRT